MTDDQIRIALAEASQGIIEYTEGVWFYWSNGRLFSCKDNDPLEDLNACAQFEATLANEEKTDFIRELNKGDFSYRRLAFATARQRCLAYLKTKGILP